MSRSVRKPGSAGGPCAEGERLQKVLAAAGVASRRECEQLILDGRVEVDRRVVTELGTRVDPQRQTVRVDGVVITHSRRVYFAVNKPPGVVSTNSDPAGRMRVIDLIQTDLRLFPIGRLDRSSEGLILVTNDGALAQQLTHPRFGIHKTYIAEVAGHPSREKLQQLRKGIRLAEAWVKVEQIKVRRRRKQATELEIVLTEGRNREIRRILARVGNKVLRLQRVAVGPIRLGALPVGGVRKLSQEELKALRAAVKGMQRRGSRAAKATDSDGGGRTVKRKREERSASRPPRKPGQGRAAAVGRKRPRTDQSSQVDSAPLKSGSTVGSVIGGEVEPPAGNSKSKGAKSARAKAAAKSRARSGVGKSRRSGYGKSSGKNSAKSSGRTAASAAKPSSRWAKGKKRR